MKKTKLLTSLAALALVVSLGACEVNIDVGDVDVGVDVNPNDSSEPDEGGTTDSDTNPGTGEGGEGGDTDTGSGSGEGGGEQTTYTYSLEVENGDSLTLNYDGALDEQTGVDLSINLVTTASTGDVTTDTASADDVTLTPASEGVIAVSGLTVTPVGAGNTSITITWSEHDVTTSVDVVVSDVTITYSYSIDVENKDNLLALKYDAALETAQETLELSIYLVTTPSTGEVSKVKASASDVDISGYDQEVISINNLVVTPLAGGSTTITIAWDDKATETVTVAVEDVTEPASEFDATIYEADERYHIYPDGTIEVHQVVYDTGTTETGHCKVCDATNLKTDRITYATDDGGQTYYAKAIQSTSSTEFYVVCEYEGAPVTGLGTPGATSYSSGGFNTACQQLQFLGIPTTIDTVYPYAFYNCQYLTTLDFAQPISVGRSSFYYCHALTGTIEVAEGQTSIDGYVFQECYGLTSITLPDTVTSIGDSAFKSCTSLKSFEMPDSVTTISSSDQLSGCTSLEYLKVSANATSLPNRFASSCTALKTVVIPSGTTTINSGAFTGDTALTTVYYGGSAEQWATASSGVTILSDLTPIYYNDNQ